MDMKKLVMGYTTEAVNDLKHNNGSDASIATKIALSVNPGDKNLMAVHDDIAVGDVEAAQKDAQAFVNA